MEAAPVRYARSGEYAIAYQALGSGPVDLVLVSGQFSHLTLDLEEPRYARFLERLASFARVIRFDRRGTGLSDRPPGVVELEQRADDVRAVLDALGVERAALFGWHEGGPTAELFATTYPERTSALILFCTYASRIRRPGYPWGPTNEEFESFAEGRVEDWAMPSTLELFVPGADQALRSWWQQREQAGSSPGAVRATLASNAVIDVRPVLGAIQAPTLVMHRRASELLPLGHGQYLAEHIPGARLVELPGDCLLPFLDLSVAEDVEEFLTGARPAPSAERVLATLLFTDVVASTERLQAVGDHRWAELLAGHDRIVRSELARYAGEEIDHAGDGFLALFDGPARAILCAMAIRERVRDLGLAVRMGLHTGEVERAAGSKPSGIAVHIGARVAAHAGAEEILVSSTTRDLVAGSGIVFEDRGEHELKGLDETRRLYAVG